MSWCPAHFTAAGMSSQHNQSYSFCFKRPAFYQSLKSTVGLAAAKAAALRIISFNLNVEDCEHTLVPVQECSVALIADPLRHTS